MSKTPKTIRVTTPGLEIQAATVERAASGGRPQLAITRADGSAFRISAIGASIEGSPVWDEAANDWADSPYVVQRLAKAYRARGEHEEADRILLAAGLKDPTPQTAEDAPSETDDVEDQGGDADDAEGTQAGEDGPADATPEAGAPKARGRRRKARGS